MPIRKNLQAFSVACNVQQELDRGIPLSETLHVARTELDSGLDEVRRSPADLGRVELIVIRPDENLRESLQTCQVSPYRGLHGDRWDRGSKKKGTGNQITLMNTRVIQLIATSRERWPLAGDNLFVDLDLSTDNLKAGQQLAVGTTLFEVTDLPHNGCKKFARRFGVDAVKFVSTPIAHQLNLRGIHVRVLQGGSISVGDLLRKVP